MQTPASCSLRCCRPVRVGALSFCVWVFLLTGSVRGEDAILPGSGAEAVPGSPTETGIEADADDLELTAEIEGEMALEEGTRFEGPTPEVRRHLVQEGDTLWSISQMYMIDPFYWPRVWEINRHIPNPDLIYPGTVVFLPTAEALERMQALVPPPPFPQRLPGEPPPPQEAPIPGRVGPAFTEIVPEERPPDPVQLASAGYILTGDIRDPGALIGVKDEKVLVGAGDIVYIKPGSGYRLQAGDILVPYRKVRPVYHPKTGRFMGNLIVVLGKIRVEGTERGIATAKVDNSYHSIANEDSVVPIDTLQLPSLADRPIDRLSAVEGYVVDVRQEKAIIGQFDVVYIDKGTEDGIGRGSSFKVIREGKRISLLTRLPSRIVGELEVIAVGEKTAVAKVRKSSESIYRGDRIETLPSQ